MSVKFVVLLEAALSAQFYLQNQKNHVESKHKAINFKAETKKLKTLNDFYYFYCC